MPSQPMLEPLKINLTADHETKFSTITRRRHLHTLFLTSVSLLISMIQHGRPVVADHTAFLCSTIVETALNVGQGQTINIAPETRGTIYIQIWNLFTNLGFLYFPVYKFLLFLSHDKHMLSICTRTIIWAFEVVKFRSIGSWDVVIEYYTWHSIQFYKQFTTDPTLIVSLS